MRVDRHNVKNVLLCSIWALQIFYLIGLIELHELLEFSASIFRLHHARANKTGAQKKKNTTIELTWINDSLNIFSASPSNPEPTYFTNQVGQPSSLSLWRPRSGTMFISSTRLTTARGTWTTEGGGTLVGCLWGCDVINNTVQGTQHTCLWRMSRASWIRRAMFLGEKKVWKDKNTSERLLEDGLECHKPRQEARKNIWKLLTASVQKSQMSLPPMNMVITFQSFWKSTRCEGETASTLPQLVNSDKPHVGAHRLGQICRSYRVSFHSGH